MKDMTENVEIFYVPNEIVPEVWGEVQEIMEKSIATSNGNFFPHDVLDHIMEGFYMLWIAKVDGEIVAGITTRVIEYPNARSLSMDWIGGSQMQKWLPVAHEIIVDHAKANGCSQIEGYGRKAWGRWLAKYGWKPNYIAFKMELGNG